VKELVAVMKELTERLYGYDADRFKAIVCNRIFNIPEIRSIWRFKLYILCIRPELFKDKVREYLFRLFEEDDYTELIYGAEYRRFVGTAYPIMSVDDKEVYFNNVIKYFSEKNGSSDLKKMHMNYGSEILSMIPELSQKQIKLLSDNGFKFIKNYEPSPAVSGIKSGMINDKGPVDANDLNKLSIKQIVDYLESKWSPAEIIKNNASDDYFTRINADGMGETVKEDMMKRPLEYIDNCELFFDRDNLDKHYTYSFLYGLKEILRNKRGNMDDKYFKKIVIFLLAIVQSGEKKEFDQEERGYDHTDGWLAGWRNVHSAMADLCNELLREVDNKLGFDFKSSRDTILVILKYLLNYYPITYLEEKEIFKNSDPYDIAINSIRGKSFQALTLFIYQDGKEFNDKDTIKINTDVKRVYEDILDEEKSRSMMFLFGYNLAYFYYRDKDWMDAMFGKVFPKDDMTLYTASLEGYLSNNLYESVFNNAKIRDLYKEALNLEESNYPNQKHFKDPDKGIAQHIALAIINYDEFTLASDLSKLFFKVKSIARYKEFIEFIGNSYIVNYHMVKSTERGQLSKCLMEIWDYLLELNLDAGVYAEFAHWLKTENCLFKLDWLAAHLKESLKKSNGVLTWDHYLNESIVDLAKASPKDSLEISRLFLLEGCIKGKGTKNIFSLDDNWVEAFRILHNDASTKDDTVELVGDLMEKGGRVFWELKDALK